MKLAAMLLPVIVTGQLIASSPSPPPPESTSGNGLAIVHNLMESSDPTAAFNALSHDDKRIVKAALTVEKVTNDESRTTQVAPSPADLQAAIKHGATSSVSCWDVWNRWAGRNMVGGALVTWWQGLRWCGDGTKVTSYNVYDRGGETSTPGWHYEGHSGDPAYRYLGWEVRAITREKFRLSLGPWDPQNPILCGQNRGGASGASSNSQSCSM